MILGDLYRSGFDITENHEEADAIVVNTCGFIEDAKTESLEVGHAGSAQGMLTLPDSASEELFFYCS